MGGAGHERISKLDKTWNTKKAKAEKAIADALIAGNAGRTPSRCRPSMSEDAAIMAKFTAALKTGRLTH